MKVLLPLLLFLALPVIAQAQFVYATFTYITNNGAITITGAQFDDGGDRYPINVLDIPAMTNGLPVTSIGTNAFDDNLPIVNSVTIPDSITSIGAYAFFFDLFELYDGNFTIPNSVTSIGDYAFANCDISGTLTIPNSVTNIGDYAFSEAVADVILGNGITSIGNYVFAQSPMTSITIPDSVTSIGNSAFIQSSLTSITIPNSVISIELGAFFGCPILTNVIIGSGITNIGSLTFKNDSDLAQVYFAGNSPIPTNDTTVFSGVTNATVYYLPGTTGWGATFDGVPTALWFQPNPAILSFEPNFGVGPNGFGFPISWATNLSVVVQASTNLANPVWSSVATNTLANGTSYFSDPQWTNYPARFYRLSSP